MPRPVMTRQTGLLDGTSLATERPASADPNILPTRNSDGGDIIKQRMVSLAELERITGLSRSTLHREIRNGKLQAVKCGTRTLIPVEAVGAYLAGLAPAATRASGDRPPEQPPARSVPRRR